MYDEPPIETYAKWLRGDLHTTERRRWIRSLQRFSLTDWYMQRKLGIDTLLMIISTLAAVAIAFYALGKYVGQ